MGIDAYHASGGSFLFIEFDIVAMITIGRGGDVKGRLAECRGGGGGGLEEAGVLAVPKEEEEF